MTWQSLHLPLDVTHLAPDGSEIRELVQTERGSLVHCRLPAGAIITAVRHRTVEEVWYCVSGNGELWRSDGVHEEVVQLAPGTSVSIPVGVSFQFRANASEALELVLVTMPPWPGASEAVPVAGHWIVRAT